MQEEREGEVKEYEKDADEEKEEGMGRVHNLNFFIDMVCSEAN